MLHGMVIHAALLAVACVGAAAEAGEELSLLQTTLDQSPGNASRLDLAAKPVPGIQPPGVFHDDFTSDSKSAPASPAPAAQGSSFVFSMHAVVAEYLAMTLFVIIGCGTACAIAKDPGSAWVLQVALAFGFAITALAYSLGRYSGGQINCAVTFALWVKGHLSLAQAAVNFAFQMLGSVTGAIVLCIIYPKDKDKTGDIATNSIAHGFSHFNVLLGEFAMTFVLVLVVFESGKQASPASGIATIPIGFAVFLAHCVLIPIDGCSINPTRSFGPALLASMRDKKGDYFKDHWVFWVGPLLGALAATGVHALFGL